MRRLVVLLVAVVLVGFASSASAQERRVELRFQGGIEVGVPIFLDVDRSIVKPGASFAGWGGFDIGWFVVDFALGFQWNWLDTANIPDVIQPIGRQPLVRLHFSPGIRLQIPTFEPVLPYIAGAFDANIWKFEALGAGCLSYYCRNDSDGQYAPGFTGKGGVAIHLKGRLYLDVGLQYSFSGRGNFFERSQWWLEPFIGVIYRGDRDRFGGTGY